MIEFAIACLRGIVVIGVAVPVIGVVLFVTFGAIEVFDPGKISPDLAIFFIYSPAIVLGGLFAIGVIFGMAAVAIGIYDTQRQILAATLQGNKLRANSKQRNEPKTDSGRTS
jgi:hypothetical protein